MTISVTKKPLDDIFNHPLVAALLSRGTTLVEGRIQSFPGGSVIWNIIKPYAAQLAQLAGGYLQNPGEQQIARARKISELCSCMTMTFRKELDAIYQQLIETMKQNRLRWLKERRDSLTDNASLEEREAQKTKLNSTLQTARELCDAIRIEEENSK